MSKVLVDIHGAGKQMSNYYEEALAALTRILGAKPACLACWYADLANIGSAVRALRPLPPQADEIRAALMEEMRQRQQELARVERARPDSRRAGGTIGGKRKRRAATLGASPTGGLADIPATAVDVVADVVRYLFDSKLQKAIKQRLGDVLLKAAEGYDETILVSHSLGTVVAFDVLRDAADAYKVSRFITMGSPLRKLATVGCHPTNLGAITRKTVPFWRNLYDTTDLVADAIGPAFPGYPIEDVFIQVADAPVPSHDYWRNRQVLEMIAGWL